MSVAKILQTTSSYLVDVNKNAITLAPKVIHKPRVMLYWLITARWAQIATIIIALTMPSLVPNTVNHLYNKFSPPPATVPDPDPAPTPAPKPQGAIERISNFFQRIQDKLDSEKQLEEQRKKQQEEQRKKQIEKQMQERKVVIRTILWSSSGVLVILLLWLHIPKAVNLASKLAREREEQADNLATTQSFESLLLYQSAIALSVSPEYELSLNEKIAAINQLSSVSCSNCASASSSSSVQSSDCQQTAFVDSDTQDQLETYMLASRYRVKKLLGKGAMGYVYLAHDTVLDRDVAIKQLSPNLCHDEQFIGRFIQEAKALAKLSHPNIVHVHDLMEDGDNAWIVMEYVEGEELADKLVPGKAMPFGFAVKLAVQMSQAMQYAHDRGVVHRDFKPANVLVTPEKKAKIMDFGLAKFNQSAGLTQVGTVMGSPAYMSPEQAAGKPVDSRTDIYALGVTLYEMFSGVKPFDGDLPSIISQHLTAVPKSPRKHNKAIPTALERTILQMMAKKPDDRPTSMKEVFNTFQAMQKKRTA